MIPIRSPHLLIQACFGVLMGALLSLFLVALFVPGCGNAFMIPSDLLRNSTECSKVPEKAFYILTLLFSGIGAYVATARYMKFSRWFLLVMLASLPVMNILARHILRNGEHVTDTIVTLFLFAACVVYLYVATKKQPKIAPQASPKSEWQLPRFTYFILAVVITLILLPDSFSAVAAHIAASPWNSHIVSYLVAPALYFLGQNLLPGIDYFTQYSLGIGWIYSAMLGANTQEAITNYIWLTITLTWLFYLQMLYLLFWLYRSWLIAAVVTLLSLILLFVIDIHFVAPSSQGVLRYPLLGIAAMLLAWYAARPSALLRQILLAGVIAASIFLNTETGVIMAIAVSIACMLTTTSFLQTFIVVLRLGLLSFLLLTSILLLVFGRGILTIDFVKYIFEPLILYGQSGMGGFPIAWTMHDFNAFFNLITPAVALATIALTARQAQVVAKQDQARLIVLVFFAITGLLMMFKYVNMAIIGVWQVNALCLLIPVGWWINVVMLRLQAKSYNTISLGHYSLRLSYLGQLLLVLSAIWMAAFTSDSRNPALYGIQSWAVYPSYVASVFGKHPKGCFSFDCVKDNPSTVDIALIQSRTIEGEQVAMISERDWVYLVDAHRAPLMFFLPSTMIFTKRLLAESVARLERAPYLFLPKGKHKEPVITGPLNEILIPHFKDNYVFDGEGDKLTVWRRKNLSVSKR